MTAWNIGHVTGSRLTDSRFCCANAEMSHALHHWRYALNESVLDWLAADGHLTPEKILERENLRRKKREKLANRIVDGMETRGVMKVLYKQFKENLAAARDAKVSDSKYTLKDERLIRLSAPAVFRRTLILKAKVTLVLFQQSFLVLSATGYFERLWLDACC